MEEEDEWERDTETGNAEREGGEEGRRKLGREGGTEKRERG